MSPLGWFSIRRGFAVAIAGMALAGCQYDAPKDLKPVPSVLKARMEQIGMSEIAPIFIRLFKEESEFEVWKQRKDGKYALLKTYGICKWSGEIGPKKAEGDRQAPEGFYTVTPAQINPNSSYYLSFDIGYPNAYDRALGRTGANLMVHGACSSRGCYSMTDDIAGEIFALARDAFRGGQRAFELEAFPFRMTAENMARHRDNPNMPFWKMLKDGYDHFEVMQVPPKVDVCSKRYVFNADAGAARFSPAAACPAFTIPEPIRVAVAAKQEADETAYKVAVARLEDEDAKKVAEDARRQEAEVRKVAEMERREQERAAKGAAKAQQAEIAVAIPAKASTDDEPTEPAAEKKSRFGFLKTLFNRRKPAAETNMASDFDAGAAAAAVAMPVPQPRPTYVATVPAKPPVQTEAAAPSASKPTKQAATTPAVPPKPTRQAEAAEKSAAPASPPKPAGAAEVAEKPSTPPAEGATPKPPATASTRPPAENASSATSAPARPAEPVKKTPEEKNFDDVFG